MKRIDWIDTTKAIGMFLVFYGHYVERIYKIEGANGIAIMQFKFIYSFHMPLFFALSGFFAKNIKTNLEFVKKLIFQRLIPVFSFGLFFIPLWLAYNKFSKGDFLFTQIFERGVAYIRGNPNLNFITWFLVCLFTVEMIACFLGLISNSKSTNFISGLIFITIGYFIIDNYSIILPYIRLPLNFWYIHEGIIALGFYLIGNGMFYLINKINLWVFYPLIPLILFLMVLSFNYFDNNNTVIMAISKHGNFIPFIINSFLGIMLMISLGKIIPSNDLIKFVGSNTLILLGLNGAFHHFFNLHIARFTYWNDSWWYITLNCILITLISMVICYPIITFINKYLPQLFGKPFKNGPVLKPLNSYFSFGDIKRNEQL